MGDLSEHFSRAEFTCHHCGQLKLELELVQVLEQLRHRIGRPLPIVSGYRCQIHNAAVGGAPNSQHLFGRAADIPIGKATVAQAIRSGARGIGYRGRWAVHLDTRPGAVVTFPDP